MTNTAPFSRLIQQGITFEKARRATNRSLKMTIWSLGSYLCCEEKISARGRHYNTIRQGAPFYHCLPGRRHFTTVCQGGAILPLSVRAVPFYHCLPGRCHFTTVCQGGAILPLCARAAPFYHYLPGRRHFTTVCQDGAILTQPRDRYECF